MRISTSRQARRAWYVCASSIRKMALVLRLSVSGSRKKSEYEEIEDADEATDVMESGEEDRERSESLVV